MKVLHVVPSISKARGGTTKAVVDMATALQSQGLSIEIATTNDDGPGLLNVPLKECFWHQDLPIWCFPKIFSSLKVINEFSVSIDLTHWLRRNITSYDLVHVHAIFSYPSTAAMVIARLLNVPYVVTLHGLLSEWSLQQSATKKQTYLRLIERTNLNCSGGLHFTALSEYQEAKPLGLSAPGFIVPHGYNSPPLLPGARQRIRQFLDCDENQSIILFLSRLHPKKGIDYLIAALAQIPHEGVMLVVAGSGDPAYENALRQFAKDYHLANQVRFVGFVEGEKKDLLLQGADLFALTSHAENFGFAVVEAMAAELPVLITPGVALATEVKRHGLGYVSELSIEAVASTLTDWQKHPAKARLMGQRARQYALKEYSWDRVAAQLIDMYTAILSQKPLSP